MAAGHIVSIARWSLPLLAVLVACQPAIFTPPRLATSTARQQIVPTASPEPLFLPAPTPTAFSEPVTEPVPAAVNNPSLTVWINETSDEHRVALQEMVERFEQQNRVAVELQLVSPALLPKLMETAVLSDTLPDIVLHPMAYTAGWADRDILDAATANEIIDKIGRDTFDRAALDMVSHDGLTAAIPSDGYQQLLIYRADWLDELGMPPPNSFEALLSAAESLFETESLISGIVIPTEANLATTHQAFEHLATANGCELIDEKGEVLILESACQEALDFYFALISQYSPIGVQTDTSAQNAYLSGRTGIIMTSPTMLPKLAGLDRAAPPVCPECADVVDYLAGNSGIVTRLHGADPSSEGANFGDLTYLGITTVADEELAASFAQFWFNEGYETWLSVESERKVPMRLGTSTDPVQFIEAWGTRPLAGGDVNLIDLYGETVVEQLSSGVADSKRWAFRQGQGVLLTSMYEELTLPIVLQEMLSGYFGSQQTLVEMFDRIAGLIPNYEYYNDTDTDE
jgi:multiple sugar transport system substrate-binding protein